MASNPRIIVRQATLMVDGKSSASNHSRRIAKQQHCNSLSLHQLPEAWDAFLADLTGMHSVTALRRSLFAHGHGHAAVCLLVAITINHMRRLLIPSVSQFFWPHALADMKLARSAPHHFIEQSLSFDWISFAVWAVVTYLFAMLPRLLGQVTTASGGYGSSRNTAAACIIMYVVVSLAWAEHTYVQSCWTLSQLYACGTLIFRGGDAEHAFLQSLLEDRSARVTAVLGLVAEGLHFRVLPVVQQAIRGRWAVVALYLGMVMSTAYMVRYSNKYFVVLELSDMWITFGWTACALALLGMEVLRRRVKADSEPGSETKKESSRIAKTR